SLSREAVSTLAGDDAERVWAETRGNPFYVSELLASRPCSELQWSLATSVLVRAGQLHDDARRLIEAVSIVPGRIHASLLDAVLPEWSASVEAPARRHL